MRGDVEIAANQLAGFEALVAEPVFQLVEEVEFVPEFRVDLGVGLVAAGGNVDRVDRQRSAAPFDAGRDVAAVLYLAEDPARDIGERKARDDGDAVIALLAVHRVMGIARVGEGRRGNCSFWHLISCRHRMSGR